MEVLQEKVRRPPEPIGIIGAGAVGQTLSRLLGCAPLLSRRAPEAGTSELTVTGSPPVEVMILPLDPVSLAGFQTLVFCGKAYDLERFLDLLRGIRPATLVIASNGLGPAEAAAAALPEWEIGRLLLSFGMRRSTTGEITVSGTPRGAVAFDREPSSALETLAVRLRTAGMELDLERGTLRAEWKKVRVNLVVNSLCTLLRADNGALLESSPLRAAARSILEEAATVASLDEAGGLFENPDDVLDSVSNHRRNRNSTLVDIEAGSRTETPWLLGAVVERGRRAGIAMPRSELVLTLLREFEARSIRVHG